MYNMVDDYLTSSNSTKLEARSGKAIFKESELEQLYEFTEGKCLWGDPMMIGRRQMCGPLFSYSVSHFQVHMHN